MRSFQIRRLLSRPRVCVFCGRPPAAKTREHIIPRWLIEQTGDPSRRIVLGPLASQSVIHGRSDPFKSLSFDSFAFPSCSSCNSRFAELEGRAKPAVSTLLAACPLCSSDFEVILDWFDKVRVGLWLAYHYFLDRNYWGVQPHFFIADRLGVADRCLLVYRAESYEPGIRFAGVNTPAFAHMPSCFTLIINEWLLVNISYQLLLSEAAGLPYAASIQFGPEEKLYIELEPGMEALKHPLVPLKHSPQAIVIGQAILPPTEAIGDAPDLYSSDYVVRMTTQDNRGKVLLDKGGQISLYPDQPTLEWCPTPGGKYPNMLSLNAVETLELQNQLIGRLSLSPSLSPGQKQFMETQNANCIEANNQLLDLLKEG